MSNEVSDSQNNSDNSGCSEAGCGCGCSIVIIWIICHFVGWAWDIHWLFGLLLLLFILSM